MEKKNTIISSFFILAYALSLAGCDGGKNKALQEAEQARQGLQRLGRLSLGVHPQEDAGIPQDLCQGAEIRPGLHPAITMPDQNSLHAVRLLRVAPGERGAGS